MVDPLPQLRAGDLGGGGVLHEVVERDAAGPPQPRLQILHAHADVVPEAGLGARALRDAQQVLGGDAHVVALDVELVRRRHVRVEDFPGHGDEARMSHPGSVVAVLDLAQLVRADLVEGGPAGVGVVLDRDLRGHAPHRVRAAPVAGLHEQLRVGAQERLLHGDLASIGHHERGVSAQRLDRAEDVVPSPAVEARGVLAQLVEDLVHLEGGGQRLDEHGGLDRAPGNAQGFLRAHEHVVPQARLEVALHLRKVEVRAGAAREELPRVVEEVEPEVEERGGNGSAVEPDVLLGQVPAPRPHHQRRHLRPQRIDLARAGLDVADAPPHGVAQVALPLDDVLPGGRVRVLEVRHEHARARVEGVDDHLPVHGTRDLHAPVEEVGRERRHRPGALANRRGLRQEARALPGVEARLPLAAPGQRLLDAPAEAAREVGHELQGRRREHGAVTGRRGRQDLEPAHRPVRRGHLLTLPS